jgi:hypothetical protein
MRRSIEILLIKPSDFVNQVPVEHIVFDPNGQRVPSLPELITLACTIINYSMTYFLIPDQPNCYWFCYAAIEYLKVHYSHKQSPHAERKQQGTWSLLAQGKVYKEIDFDLLAKDYGMSWDFFNHNVCFVH